MTYTVALVADAVEVGDNPATLQGIVKNGQYEWSRLGGARLVANKLATFGLVAVVVDDDGVVAYCTAEVAA